MKGEVYVVHHWTYLGEWWYGRCDACGWKGREVRLEETARKWMENHKKKCKLHLWHRKVFK